MSLCLKQVARPATSISLVESLLPEDLAKICLREDCKNMLREEHVLAIAKLLNNLVLETISATNQRDFRKLDANPGDGGCQTRALELYYLNALLLKEPLKGECESLYKTAKEIERSIQLRIREKNPLHPQAFLQKLISPISSVSCDMEYLLHCRLSKILRNRIRVEADGIIVTQSDVNLLSKLSPKIEVLRSIGSHQGLSNQYRKDILQRNQTRLSKLSVERIRVQAEKIVSLETSLIKRMLSAEHTHLYSPNPESYQEKHFGCLFYEMLTLLALLKENKAIVMLKKIKASKEDCDSAVFLQPRAPSKEFEVLSHEEAEQLPPETPLIVIESVFYKDAEEIMEEMSQHNLSEMLLIQASLINPYESGTTIEDIKDEEARLNIEQYREKSKRAPKLFKIDHICMSTLAVEMKQ